MLKGTTIREKFDLVGIGLSNFRKHILKAFNLLSSIRSRLIIYEEVKQEVYTGGWCAPMNELYQEAIQEKLFIPMNQKMMVQMHYGTFVYMLKAHLHGIFELE
ncbi:hypothetical protein [Paenibacillus ottowii]